MVLTDNFWCRVQNIDKFQFSDSIIEKLKSIEVLNIMSKGKKMRTITYSNFYGGDDFFKEGESHAQYTDQNGKECYMEFPLCLIKLASDVSKRQVEIYLKFDKSWGIEYPAVVEYETSSQMTNHSDTFVTHNEEELLDTLDKAILLLTEG